MPDQLTRSRRRATASPVVQAVVVVLLFLLAGAAAGFVWHAVWDAPTGVVAEGEWFPTPYEEGQRADFGGTATYVMVAVVAGLVVGSLCAVFLAASELVTLVAVTLGSAAAGWVMATVGVHLGPEDPELLARTAADGTELPGRLHVAGLSPYAAFPVGALVAVTVVYLSAPSSGNLRSKP